MGATDFRPLIPDNSQPTKTIQNGLQRFVLVSLQIGIVYPQNELPAGLASEQPIEQCGPHAANVQVTGWTGSKAAANRHA
jgi:hypothetical protein